ncbi:MAG: chemotaxis protein CheA [Candidatus Margulisiibacteriota bacterium]|nr:MAG: hypothetical protein A2X43_04590 [Candidatus Margulisbacteria bacterium GWD2_39_127]OGI01578.1 MAG: hypothetical protein A2X42_08360 [Candidatus Margulisbacteria bacterium GWF2_38_17]OGI10020.1 MAG: hypothetical protein A2X41_09070 [Candidatus Margulisbacteria bacterium GWE2_39_32]PZM78275.1 MAG: chemotaxis protein CheA [Candidatus Margulisiibacteriota bacterium]HAR61837.1 chemotaxis protein CheA [Candidatus Margulisiibacteriota bacterium]
MTDNIKEKVEGLAEALVLADYADLQALADLHTRLEEIAELTASGDFSLISAAAVELTKIIGDIMLENVSDVSASFDVIGKTVMVIQEVICNGRTVTEIVFPPELAIDEKELPVKQVEPSKQVGVESGREPNSLKGDLDLLGDFVIEALEHVHDVNNQLLILEKDPANEDAINAVFRAFHTIKGVAGFLELDEIRSLSHEAENLLDMVRKGKIILVGDLVDLTFEIADLMKELIENFTKFISSGTTVSTGNAVLVLIDKIKSAVSGKRETKKTSPNKKEITVLEAGTLPEVKQNISTNNIQNNNNNSFREAIKIDAERLDRLVDMIGELVIAESMVSQCQEVKEISSAHFIRYLSQLDKITRELHETGMSLRMIPLKTMFQKMARLVRDLSKKIGKEIDFEMHGEDIELDKSIVDKIHDPLVHMLRNALDHGIEGSCEERLSADKPPKGLIQLRAYHKGGCIYVEIQDDGRGLDKETILAKAQERGIIREGQVLADWEIFNLVFEPGFSTAKTVTDVSGRGVGMDVVKKNIEMLHGQVDISSIPGKGSLFVMKLPLTLAIIEGMFVRVGKERYIIPSLSIIRSIRPDEDIISTVVNKGEVISLKDRLIPVFRINKLYNIETAEQILSQSIIVVVENEGHQIGLVIDELLGQQQVVIKNLGEAMKNIPGISGCTIMPDGNVGLILDISGLVKLAEGREDVR